MERGLLAVPRGVTPFTGVVLAGGRSSRMGRDKAMLVVDGCTLLDRAIAVLRDAGATTVLVSGDRPLHGGIGDRVPFAGPVGGIASVLPEVADGATVVVPVDLPDLDVATLVQLLGALEQAPAACFEGHPLPWAARVDQNLRVAIERVMQEMPGGPAMRALHGAIRGIEIPPPAPHVLRNLNTPADFEDFSR
ncbi:molybdenum cofactor guanylyltransferase [Lysobacter sp. TY2-98]|uniref:molybdenum cofactor guanylyltransferase n=1 Tax=Lysobacter sp. TY2-98 TaxID=2290922 RepID=UPI000E208F29|nr:molybdenum cofactor guanylyltransferase [Lysobacter sp. TY2-98]AXK71497.1 molybdenum cofactor guanylyltransferase [Lysobacter sp. TY2-98]